MKLLTAILILALALPGTALAKKHPSQGQFSIPLDNSGVAQYLEVIPTAGGGRPSGGLHSQRTPSPTQSTTQSAGTVTPSAPITPSAVAPSTQRVLATHGARGRQAARVANETAPSGIRPLPAGSAPVSPPSQAPVSAAGLPVGPGLPIVLIAVAVGALALTAARRRRVS